MFPSKSDCYKLWEKYHLPQQKRIHSEVIAHVADIFAQELIQRGIPVDRNLLYAACLLHDIDKAVKKEKGEKHPESAVRILQEENLSAIAAVVRTHSLHCILDPQLQPTTWEQKLLYLSDKMVKYALIGVNKRFDLWRAEDLSLDAVNTLDAAYPHVKALEQEVYNASGCDFRFIKQKLHA